VAGSHPPDELPLPAPLLLLPLVRDPLPLPELLLVADPLPLSTPLLPPAPLLDELELEPTSNKAASAAVPPVLVLIPDPLLDEFEPGGTPRSTAAASWMGCTPVP
jgi:hypothetical protein